MARMMTPQEAARALRALPALARAGAVQVMNDTAEEVTTRAAALAPVRTGRLAAAIDSRKAKVTTRRPAAASGVRMTRGGVSRGEVFEGDRDDPFYWKFQEYGTRRHGAHPMFRPAALAVEQTHQANMMRALDQAAEDMAVGRLHALSRLSGFGFDVSGF